MVPPIAWFKTERDAPKPRPEVFRRADSSSPGRPERMWSGLELHLDNGIILGVPSLTQGSTHVNFRHCQPQCHRRLIFDQDTYFHQLIVHNCHTISIFQRLSEFPSPNGHHQCEQWWDGHWYVTWLQCSAVNISGGRVSPAGCRTAGWTNLCQDSALSVVTKNWCFRS